MMSKLVWILALLLPLRTYGDVVSIEDRSHHEWRENQYSLVLEELRKSLREGVPDLEPMIDFSHRFIPGAPDLPNDPRLCQAHFNLALVHLFGQKPAVGSKEKTYSNFMQHLRASLRTRYYESHKFKALDIPLLDMIQTTSMLLYHGIHIQSYLDSLWQTIAAHGGYKLHLQATDQGSYIQLGGQTPTRKHLLRIRSRLKNLMPIYEGIKTGKSLLNVKFKEKTRDTIFGGVTWLSFDPASMGNIPYVKYRLKKPGQEELLTYIRMPTPTLNSDKSTSICPEFLAYLAYLKNRGHKHLYLNYQDNIKPQIGKIKSARQFVQAMGIGNESFRSEAVEMLAQSPEFGDTAVVLTFSKDSRFYKQSGREEKDLMSARTFIERYLRTMFDLSNHGFYVPPSWKMTSSHARQDVRAYLERVHKWFFDSKPFLDRSERRDFIEISYLFLGDYASRDVYSVNQTCKTGIDRAGAANTMTFLMHLMIYAHSGTHYNEANFDQLLSSLEAMLFSDAIMAKKREIKRSRLQRFQSAAIRMLDCFIANPYLLDEIRTVLGNREPILEWK